MAEETEHITTSKMERFCERALDQTELTSVAHHLAGCANCSNEFVTTLKRNKGTSTLAFSLAPDFWLKHEHLDYDHLLMFSDNKLDTSDEEQINLHLERCAPCQEDVRSFLAFRNQIAPEMTVSYLPSSLEAVRHKSMSWNPFRSFAWKPIYATAIVLIGIVVVLAALFLKWRSDDLEARKPATPNVNEGNQNSNPSDNRASNTPTSTTPPNESPIETPNSAALVTLNDGGRTVIIDAAGNVSGLDDVPTSTRGEIAQALLSERLARPSILKELKGEDSSLRGSDTRNSFKLISPARTVVVSNRPIFKWQRVDGASNYRVYLSGPGGIEVAKSDQLPPDRIEWTSTNPLRRGEIYTWSVVAVVEGKEIVAPSSASPEVKFQVMSSSSLLQLKKLRTTQSHLALGVFFAQHGMVTEAKRELEIVTRNNPGSPSAKKLLRQIQSW